MHFHSPDNAQDLEDSIIANRRTLDDRCALLQEVRGRRVRARCGRCGGGGRCGMRKSTQQVCVVTGLAHGHGFCSSTYYQTGSLRLSLQLGLIYILSVAPILHASAPPCHPCTRCCSSNSIDKFMVLAARACSVCPLPIFPCPLLRPSHLLLLADQHRQDPWR